MNNMGKYMDKFEKGAKYIDDKANDIINGDNYNPEKIEDEMYDNDDNDKYEIGIQVSQKPESFHHFILENQYKDIEKNIRGYKDVFNKETQKWELKRKKNHCFTDEESEDIVRTAQSHLSTDIKLSYIKKDKFGELMMAIYDRIDELFYAIAEYRYGRYSINKDGTMYKDAHTIQYQMKLQNRKIFLELWTRIQANYSRAIQGQENKATHGSVKGQESLQNTDRNESNSRSYI